MIEGVIITPLKIVIDERGQTMRMLRNDDPHFLKFGEIYFSGINPGIIKGWKVHKRSCGNLCVPVGKVKFVIYDPREGSPTQGQFQELILGEDGENYKLLTPPPGVAYAWKNLSDKLTIVANCATEPWSADESVNLPLDEIEYDWE